MLIVARGLTSRHTRGPWTRSQILRANWHWPACASATECHKLWEHCKYAWGPCRFSKQAASRQDAAHAPLHPLLRTALRFSMRKNPVRPAHLETLPHRHLAILAMPLHCRRLAMLQHVGRLADAFLRQRAQERQQVIPSQHRGS